MKLKKNSFEKIKKTLEDLDLFELIRQEEQYKDIRILIEDESEQLNNSYNLFER